MGAIGVSNTFICDTKNNLHHKMEDLCGGKFIHIDDYAQYLPFATGVALEFAHVPAKHSFRERVATTATAVLIMGTIVSTVNIPSMRDAPTAARQTPSLRDTQQRLSLEPRLSGTNTDLAMA